MTLDEAMRIASRHHGAGQLAEAEATYRQILAHQPRHVEALHMLGILAAQTGRPDVAVELIGRAVATRPDYVEAQSNLGNALQASGHLEEAVVAYRQALRLEPGSAGIHNNLGGALQRLGRADDAIAAYREAIRLKADYPEAHSNLAHILQARGQFPEALDAFQQAVRLKPADAAAHLNLGNALHATGRSGDALVAYQEALRLEPAKPEVYNSLGICLRTLGHIDKAVAAYRQVIRLSPAFAEAHSNLGNALGDLGHLDEALASCRRAVELAPQNAGAQNNLGHAYRDLGLYGEAVAAYRRAIQITPQDAGSHHNLAYVLRALDQIDESVAECLEALRLNPDYNRACNTLGNCYKDQGRVDLAIEQFRKAVVLDPRAADVRSNLAYSVYFHPDYDPLAILAENREWDRAHGQPLARQITPHENSPSPERRLRLGYVSADLRHHVVGWNLLPLLQEAESVDFEIFCYADVPSPDGVTAQLRSLSHHWRSIAGVANEQVAEMIRADQIDILVDLALHTAGNKQAVFARKPAPVQVTYLGYCGTTGLSAMDYRLSDPYLDPPGTDLACYSEQTIRLPHSYWCYQPVGPTPEVTAPPFLTAAGVTFSCLNNFAKVSPAALDLWAAILRAVPRSRLLLQAPAGSCRDDILRRFARHELSFERVEFVGRQPWEQYIQCYQSIDIALDPFPYGGGISTCDALWMGVPVVTLSGHTAVGRAGRSILSNIGLPELIAETPKQYVEIAVALASDLPRLSGLRSTLRERIERSPIRDAARHARDVEAAFREMWRTWCQTKELNPDTR